MDNGYPQVTAVTLLTNYIQSGKANFDVAKVGALPGAEGHITTHSRTRRSLPAPAR
jgi:hypothetical protein